jgi:1,4-dihydroxy-2-naphthoyl-CoA hydrolase
MSEVELPGNLDHRDLAVPVDRMWSATVGLEIFDTEDGLPAARLPVTEKVCQPMGLLHGGIYACVAEELASMGTARLVHSDGKFCVGQSNLTHFLRPARLGGVLHARARPLHRGRTTWIWEVEATDEEGRLCAKTTVTMAVREGDWRATIAR